MEPIPETTEVIGELEKWYDSKLLHELHRRAEAVRELVPDVVGLSVGSLENGVACTLVATAAEVAVLDAIQYLVGGPCVKAPEADQVLDYEPNVSVDEERWQTFARATAAKGVANTLTLPILHHGRGVGTVNLYAASARAFTGLHQDIADVFGAWAPGAVVNSDLSFRSRRTVEVAPAVVRAAMRGTSPSGSSWSAGRWTPAEPGNCWRKPRGEPE